MPLVAVLIVAALVHLIVILDHSARRDARRFAAPRRARAAQCDDRAAARRARASARFPYGDPALAERLLPL
jgi:hypothetical protein